MSMTVKYKIDFPRQGPRRANRAPHGRTAATDANSSTTAPGAAEHGDRGQVCRAARMLALAYCVDRLVADGEIRSYAQAARLLGLTRARVSQLMNLLNLAPAIQAAILTGDLRVSEPSLRRVAQEVEWGRQAEILGQIAPAGRQG